MEFREIIIVFGLVAIIVILWDGFRRMKMKPKKPKARVEPAEDWVDPDEAAKKAQIARELPNGGARTREMTEEEKQEISSKFKLNLRERVPMLMERVVVEGEESDAERLESEAETTEKEEVESAVQSELDFSIDQAEKDQVEADPDVDNQRSVEQTDTSEDAIDVGQEKDDLSFSATQEDQLVDHVTEPKVEEIPVEQESISKADVEPASLIDSEDTTEDESIQAQEPEPEPPMPVEDLIVVHVMAKDGGEINGQALLELLVHSGLRHGPMDIFHYRNPNGKTEFSLANCVQPGTFNPDAMADVNTPGVTLFLQLPCTADAMESFEHMIEMARFMASHLGAELLDEDHNGVTPQVVEYYREKLRAFTRKQLIPS
ncbi:cell division protein ZipA [Reinekea marina]|uniref:Cell division protein ZipA n=1 Tax=Reinekea marina TaxID=1310421 RepID=A0ABV7WVG6_9GAMM|nr:cell division protein ZipA [Reinekea marina]MDN3648905.1 cell division protein ZipA [Reinekea marina]